MRKYSFILKNVKTKNYRLISQLLVLFNLLGFVFLLINSEVRIVKNIILVFATLITAVYTFFTIMEWMSGKPLPDFWHRSIFGVCALVWMKEGFWWLSLMLLVFIVLDVIAHKTLVVHVTDKTIVVPYIRQKDVSWDEVNNVILKDGLLTIDFKNNKLFQHLILNSDEDISEKEFNEFCRQQLNK
ncbi:MAG TPA: hypothetical protein VFH08_12380 [Chitinophagaceae bacterium]|nr:hypothetical protein [Chitinophagaceae bacterium]